MPQVENPEKLALGLYEGGFVRFGDYVLKSGEISPLYINLRSIGSIDKLSHISEEVQLDFREYIVHSYGQQIDAFGNADHILGMPEAALVSSGMIAQGERRSVLQMRVKEKTHGEPVNIEGNYHEGETVVLVDDLISDGGSKFEGIQKITSHKLFLKGIAVLIDREQGGVKRLLNRGIRVEAAIGITTLIDILAEYRKIDETMTEKLKQYFAPNV